MIIWICLYGSFEIFYGYIVIIIVFIFNAFREEFCILSKIYLRLYGILTENNICQE